MAQRFLKIAVVYLFLGVLLGITMGITQNFVLVPVHAHIGLLGWATLALAGVIYHLHPAAGKTRLAIQLARDLLDEFDDGAFFVPLAQRK